MTLIERNILIPPRNENADAPSIADVLSSTLRSLRRSFWLVVFCVAICVALAIVRIATATPVYTASATIYIDPRESRGFQEAGGILLNSDALIVDSEVEILLSSTLAERVVNRLNLAGITDPAPTKTTLTARIKNLFQSGSTDADQVGLLSPQEAAVRTAVAAIRRNVNVGRLGNTYVIEIIVHNTDKQLAPSIANTYAQEYLESGLEIQAERLAQLNNWSSQALREAIGALQSAEADVNRFKLDNQIDSDDRQVVASELAELNTALVSLRSERFRNELMLERVQNFLSDGSTDTDVPDVGAEGIAEIRSQILQAEIDYARVTANGNKDTLQAGFATRELETLTAQLVHQYQRIATQLDNQIQFSTEEEQRLSDRADRLRRAVAEVSEKEAKLRELQMWADGRRAVYQTLLTRFHETSEAFVQKSSSARILTAANVPRGPSSPQSAKILALGLVAGLFIGLVLTFIREQLDNRIRQPREIEAAGLRFLGAVPTIRSGWFRLGKRRRRNPRDMGAPVLTSRRHLREAAIMSFAVDYPLSDFSETVRSIVFDVAACAPASKRAQIIAVTSTATGEGKSTLSANLAAYYAMQGKRVHLIDFDLKNPALSRVFATHRVDRTVSQTEAAEHNDPVRTDNKKLPNFDFSGHAERTSLSEIIEVVSPGSITHYLETSKENYDVVILDIGSLAESSDARMCTDLADYVVLAVKWGQTSVEQLERSLARGLNRTDHSVGAVLTMVPSSTVLEISTGVQTAHRLAVA